MKLLIKNLREAAYNLYASISGKKLRQLHEDDTASGSLLARYLVTGNLKRLMLFSFFYSFVGLIFTVFSIAGYNAELHSICLLKIFGWIFLTLISAIVLILSLGELRRKKGNSERTILVVRLFWGSFVVGNLFLITAEFLDNGFSFCFFLLLLIISSIPMFEPKESACFFGAVLLAVIIAVLASGLGVGAVLICCVFVIAFYIFSVVNYNSICYIWVSERQFNTVNERCRQMTEKDALTGLLNKKGLTNRLNDIIESGDFSTIAAIVVDIDDFKRYNQIFTDKESDDCLYNICNCIRIISKTQTDIISRFEGDEFVVILENISEYELVSFAEQIRQSIETMALPFEDGSVVTITVGVSSIGTNELKDYYKLLSEAKNSLRIAKESGKNCVGYKERAFKRK